MNVVENFSNLSTNVVIIIIIWALHCYTQSNDENMKFSYENSIPSKWKSLVTIHILWQVVWFNVLVGPNIWLDSSNGHYLIHNWVMYMGKNTLKGATKSVKS